MSKRWSKAAEKKTAGSAAGNSASQPSRNAERAQWLARETAKTEAYGRLLAATRTRGWLAENTVPLTGCGGMGCWSSDQQVGITLEVSATAAPGLGLDVGGVVFDASSDGAHIGPENVRRIIPDVGGDASVHFYPPEAVTPAMLRESQDFAIDYGNYEAFVPIHPKEGLSGFGVGIGKDLKIANVDVTWTSSDLSWKPSDLVKWLVK